MALDLANRPPVRYALPGEALDLPPVSQTEQRARMPGGQRVGAHELLHALGQFEEADCVGDGGTVPADGLGDRGVRELELLR
jgi:hypothetical protein